MSMNHPEQYPEVSSDESGIVPADSSGFDQPKKIRMLSAAELDRLTIDSAGRFYWDGKLVNYGLSQPAVETAQAADPLDRGALDLLDRAAAELAHPSNSHAAAISVAPPAPPEEPVRTTPELRAVDLDASAAPSVAPFVAVPATEAPSPAVPVSVEQPRLIAPTIRPAPELMRISLSAWQSLALVLVVLGFFAGSVGLAAHGLVTANAWGCRIGLVKQYCPLPSAPVTPPRPDIPA